MGIRRSLSDKQLRSIYNNLNENSNGNFDGCLCGYYEFNIRDLGYITIEVHCKKSNNCPSHMEWFVEDKVKIWSDSLREIGRVPTIEEAKEDNIQFLGYLNDHCSKEIKELIRKDIINNHVWNNTNEYGQKFDESILIKPDNYYVFIAKDYKCINIHDKYKIGKFIIRYKEYYIIEQVNTLKKPGIVSITDDHYVYNLNDGIKEILKLKDKKHYEEIGKDIEKLNYFDKQLALKLDLQNKIQTNISGYKRNHKDNINNRILNQLNKGLKRTAKKINNISMNIDLIRNELNDKQQVLEDWKLTFTLFVSDLINEVGGQYNV